MDEGLPVRIVQFSEAKHDLTEQSQHSDGRAGRHFGTALNH